MKNGTEYFTELFLCTSKNLKNCNKIEKLKYLIISAMGYENVPQSWKKHQTWSEQIQTPMKRKTKVTTFAFKFFWRRLCYVDPVTNPTTKFLHQSNELSLTCQYNQLLESFLTI